MNDKIPAHDALGDLVDNSFDSAATANQMPPIIPPCKYLREKANPTAVYHYTEALAQFSDKLEPCDSLPTDPSPIQIQFERRLRNATSDDARAEVRKEYEELRRKSKAVLGGLTPEEAAPQSVPVSAPRQGGEVDAVLVAPSAPPVPPAPPAAPTTKG